MVHLRQDLERVQLTIDGINSSLTYVDRNFDKVHKTIRSQTFFKQFIRELNVAFDEALQYKKVIQQMKDYNENLIRDLQKMQACDNLTLQELLTQPEPMTGELNASGEVKYKSQSKLYQKRRATAWNELLKLQYDLCEYKQEVILLSDTYDAEAVKLIEIRAEVKRWNARVEIEATNDIPAINAAIDKANRDVRTTPPLIPH